MSEDPRPCDLHAIAVRIRPFVARRVPPDDVDDVLQEILLRVHEGFDEIDDEAYFAKWLQRVAGSVVVDVEPPTLGQIALPGPPLRFFDAGGSEVTRTEHRTPPLLDQHGDSIRAWLRQAPAPVGQPAADHEAAS